MNLNLNFGGWGDMRSLNLFYRFTSVRQSPYVKPFNHQVQIEIYEFVTKYSIFYFKLNNKKFSKLRQFRLNNKNLAQPISIYLMFGLCVAFSPDKYDIDFPAGPFEGVTTKKTINFDQGS